MNEFTTERPITIYTWKDTKLNQADPKVIIKKMDNNIPGYDPEDNAQNIAKLFSMSLPGNTVDVFYDAIAEGLMHLIDPNNEFADQQHVSNIIRIAINELSEGD